MKILNWSACGILMLTTGAWSGDVQVMHERERTFATDALKGAEFGMRVAVEDGLAVVTAPESYPSFDDPVSDGAAYVIDLVTGAQLKIRPDDLGSNDGFGRSDATLHNGVVLVGAIYGEAAYLFDAATGDQILKITPPNSSDSFQYGLATALNDEFAVVSSLGSEEGGMWSGAVYIHNAQTGELVRRIRHTEAGVDDGFGRQLALDGDVLAIGWISALNAGGVQTGTVCLYDVNTGGLISMIYAPDGQTNDLFGGMVEMRDGVLAVGASGDDDNHPGSGSAYLFDVRDPDHPTLRAKLLPRDGQAWALFGTALDIRGERVIVGAYAHDEREGAAYLFDAATGRELARLRASDSQRSVFGVTVGLADDVAIVGAPWHGGMGPDSGAIYLFDTTPPCPPDVTGDGRIDMADVSLVLFRWGEVVSPGRNGDADGSGRVDMMDLQLILDSWGCEP